MLRLVIAVINEKDEVLGQKEWELKKDDHNPEANEPLTPAEKMTDAQRRFIFRLLSDQDVQGDAARQYLKEHFNIPDLKVLSKGQASALIEQLKGGGQ